MKEHIGSSGAHCCACCQQEDDREYSNQVLNAALVALTEGGVSSDIKGLAERVVKQQLERALIPRMPQF